MPSFADLTTLQNVKYWLQGNGINDAWNTNSDVQLGLYISQASRAILTYIQRPNILYASFTEKRDGLGGARMLLKNYPVLEVDQVTIDNIIVPPRPSLTGAAATPSTFPFGPVGYDFEPWDGTPPGRPQELITVGYPFHRGRLNVSVSYKTGYVTTEVLTVPASPGPYVATPTQPYGTWSGSVSVAYANGTPLTQIPSGTPTVGQFVGPPPLPATIDAPDDVWTPEYTFAAADQGQALTVSYSFVPADLDFCACKWVGEVFSYKGRIAQKSKILPQNQGTATFDLSAMPADMALMLNPYKRVVPL